MAHQISLFVENKPGKLDSIMKTIDDKNIDVKAFTIASADKFGIIKLLVDAPFKAKEMLKDSGMTVALAEVVVAEIKNMPHGMHEITTWFSERGLNIDSAFGFTMLDGEKTLLVIETQDTLQVKETLREKGLSVLSDEQIYSL